MPIRFRCAYCNQLMGISRRKARTVVRCPTCAGEVIVPEPETSGAAPPGDDPGLFERNDFDLAFQNPPPAAGAAGRSAAPSSGTRRGGGHFDVEPFPLADQRAPQTGVFLTSGKVVVLLIVLCVLLGLAFFAGFLVGRSGAKPVPAAAGIQGRGIWTQARDEGGRERL